MTVSDLLTALTTTTRVDLVVGDTTYRVESNEKDIINSATLALEIDTITLGVDGKTPFLTATTKE